MSLLSSKSHQNRRQLMNKNELNNLIFVQKQSRNSLLPSLNIDFAHFSSKFFMSQATWGLNKAPADNN